MIGLVQRVRQAQVDVAGQCVGKIGQGALLLLGVEKTDTELQLKKLADKVLGYRMFADQQGKMNLDLRQISGELLVVSQFTLVADTQSGKRPSFSKGASPEHGQAMYLAFVDYCRTQGVTVATGQFGADMQVSLINDGPVTFQFQVA